MLRGTLLYIASIAFLFILPFFSLPVLGWDAESSKILLLIVWGVIALVTGVIYVFAHKAWRNPFQVSVVGIAATISLLVLILSAAFSPVPRLSLFGDGYAIGVPLFMFASCGVAYAMSLFARNGRRGVSLFLAILGGIACVTFVSFLVLITRKIFGLSDGMAEYLFNLSSKWTDLGIYSVVFLIASVIGINRFNLRGFGTVLGYGTLVVSVCMLAVVNFILLWSALFVVSVILCVRLWMRQPAQGSASRALVWIMGSLGVVSLLFVLDNHFQVFKGAISGVSTNVFSVSSLEIHPSPESTFTVAKSVLAESPVFGFGPGRFSDAWKLYRPQGVNSTQFWSTNFTYGVGFWPTFLITSGMLGMIAILALIAAILLMAIRLYKKNDQAGVASYINQVVALSVIVLTASFFVYSPGISGALMYAVFVGFMLGFSYINGSLMRFQVSLVSRMNIVGIAVTLIVIAVAVASLWIYGTKVYARYHYNQALVTPVNDGASLYTVAEHLQRAFNNDHRDIYARALGTALYGQFNNILVSSSTSYTTDNLRNIMNNVINVSMNSIIANPYNVDNYIFVAELYRSLDQKGVSQAKEEAAKFYDAAIKYEPNNPLIRVLQARLALQDNDTQTAQTKLQEAIRLKPNYTEAVFLLSQILVAENGSNEAVAQLEARAKVAPVEPIVFFQLGFLKYSGKDYAGAITALESAVTLVPDYANALYFLGLSYYYENRVNDAIAKFEKVAALNPDNTDVKKILENLKAGKAPLAQNAVAPEKKGKLPVDEKSKQADE